MEALIAARAVAGMGGGGFVPVLWYPSRELTLSFSLFRIMTGDHIIYLSCYLSPINGPPCSVERGSHGSHSIVSFLTLGY
jgi:hypothetical protein